MSRKFPDKIRSSPEDPPASAMPPRTKKRAKVFAKPRDTRPHLSESSASDPEEVDVSLMDEESQKIDYEREDADEAWDDDYEENEDWDDLDDEEISQLSVEFAINEDPNDQDWVPSRWRKVVGKKGEFTLRLWFLVDSPWFQHAPVPIRKAQMS